MNTTRMPRALLAFLALGLALGPGFAPTPAHALTINDTIEISRKALKKKCKRAGGRYFSYKKGYECRHVTQDNRLVVIQCKNTMKCFGYATFQAPRKTQPPAPGHHGVIQR